MTRKMYMRQVGRFAVMACRSPDGQWEVDGRVRRFYVLPSKKRNGFIFCIGAWCFGVYYNVNLTIQE